MKNNIFINLVVGAIIVLTAFTSCNQDAEGVIYTPDPNASYSFASTQMNVDLTAEHQGVIKVPVYRGTTEGDATIEIQAEMDEEVASIFTLTSANVNFKSGESVAYAELNFGSIDNLGATTKYGITLSIDEKLLSLSGEGILELQAQRQLTWESYGVGVYYSELFGDSWDQPIEKAKEGNIFRLPDCIYEGYPLVFTLSDDGQELIGWDIQPVGYKHSTYGMVYYHAQGMERNGNQLVFPMIGKVVYNGGFAALYQGFTEVLELP